MIDYFKGAYNINLLPRVHGSALYKGMVVGVVSVLIYLAIALRWKRRTHLPDIAGRLAEEEDLDHPYAVGVLVSSVSFLITFRANFGYQRYWEACGAVQQLMSKWMDASIHTAVFHLQSKHYDGARPPSFFDHDELNKLNLSRARRRQGDTSSGAARILKSVYDCEKELLTDRRGRTSMVNGGGSRMTSVFSRLGDSNLVPPPSPVTPLPTGVLHGRWDVILPTPNQASSATRRRMKLNADYFPATQDPNHNFGSRPDGRTPPLFLQELAHLSSLACAVALSTLRNDIEGMESPLDVYAPGAPWPSADPDRLPRDVRRRFQHRVHAFTVVRYWLGNDRLPHNRNKHNAARPLSILGGISDAEIRFLQKARGPHAKVQLAFGWLCEFITRESLGGSLGESHSAMVSRLVQFLSDGMMGYNHARNIMYIPFPFPHAQLSSFFAVTMVLAVPFLMDQYTNVLWIGSLISFLTVTCLAGLHEVARELENPFKNVPNEIPVCLLQAMYNEALVTMFSGFNPDSFWDPEMYQGALEAVALGKVYQKSEAETTAPEMPTPTESTQQKATELRPSNKKRVSFARDVDSDSDVAKELREVLEAQALAIEELVRLLGTEESRRASGERGTEECHRTSSESDSTSSQISCAAAANEGDVAATNCDGASTRTPNPVSARTRTGTPSLNTNADGTAAAAGLEDAAPAADEDDIAAADHDDVSARILSPVSTAATAAADGAAAEDPEDAAVTAVTDEGHAEVDHRDVLTRMSSTVPIRTPSLDADANDIAATAAAADDAVAIEDDVAVGGCNDASARTRSPVPNRSPTSMRRSGAVVNDIAATATVAVDNAEDNAAPINEGDVAMAEHEDGVAADVAVNANATADKPAR